MTKTEEIAKNILLSPSDNNSIDKSIYTGSLFIEQYVAQYKAENDRLKEALETISKGSTDMWSEMTANKALDYQESQP